MDLTVYNNLQSINTETKKQFNAPLNGDSHDAPDKHHIGESLPAPSVVPVAISSGVGVIGVSPNPAREDHAHPYTAPGIPSTPTFTSVGFGNGTVGAPSIYFTSDTNTGIYRYGADMLGVSAGGVLAGIFGYPSPSWFYAPYTQTSRLYADGGSYGDPGVRVGPSGWSTGLWSSSSGNKNFGLCSGGKNIFWIEEALNRIRVDSQAYPSYFATSAPSPVQDGMEIAALYLKATVSNTCMIHLDQKDGYRVNLSVGTGYNLNAVTYDSGAWCPMWASSHPVISSAIFKDDISMAREDVSGVRASIAVGESDVALDKHQALKVAVWNDKEATRSAEWIPEEGADYQNLRDRTGFIVEDLLATYPHAVQKAEVDGELLDIAYDPNVLLAELWNTVDHLIDEVRSLKSQLEAANG